MSILVGLDLNLLMVAIHLVIKSNNVIVDRLTITSKCLLFPSRVVVSPKLQAKVLQLLHEGHPGIVRSKLLARSLFWWPTLNTDIEFLCTNCLSCAAVNFKPKKEFSPWPQAQAPFERVHIDFYSYQSLEFFYWLSD